MVTRWRKAGDECDKVGGKLSEDQTSSWFGQYIHGYYNVIKISMQVQLQTQKQTKWAML